MPLLQLTVKTVQTFAFNAFHIFSNFILKNYNALIFANRLVHRRWKNLIYGVDHYRSVIHLEQLAAGCSQPVRIG